MKKIFLRAEEVCAQLNISKQTLYNHIYYNRNNQKKYLIPPYIRLNNRLLFPIENFEQWIKEQPIHYTTSGSSLRGQDNV
jgi:predicted DNA-binding transcriptional regulator AlpA